MGGWKLVNEIEPLLHGRCGRFFSTLVNYLTCLYLEQIKAAESPITKIFGGKFRSTLRAPGQKDSVIVEDWRALRLDIQVSNFLSPIL